MKKLILLSWVICSIRSNSQTAQSYTSFKGSTYNLYKWEGDKVMLLSKSNTLDAPTMNKWVHAMDTVYDYYQLCTGKEPSKYTGVTYLNNRTTLAEVDSTCGAGCGYLGTTGIELLNTYFQRMYDSIRICNHFDQTPFYEFGRNFWFYDNQLKYKSNDPIVTGYAVYMRFMAMDAAHVTPAYFNTTPFATFKTNVKNLLNLYLADTSLKWSNTLGMGNGVPGSGLGGTDLFASFCFYLNDNYNRCGVEWVKNVWKYAGARPAAITTQDAVDNFIAASSQAANTNLVPLFTTWRWPVSAGLSAIINGLIATNPIVLNPVNTVVTEGNNASFTCNANDNSATYQWQMDAGSGFVNLSNNADFSGVSTKNLTITSVKSSYSSYKFRCSIFIGSCTYTSTHGVLTVTQETHGISTQPIDITVSEGANASFSCTAINPSSTHQWQIDKGAGFTNIVNGGQYSTATTQSLSISNATLSNHNDKYRCIIKIASFSDTSHTAILKVNQATNSIGHLLSETVSISPNPFHDKICIHLSQKASKIRFALYSASGQIILMKEINQIYSEFDLSRFESGIYYYQLNDGVNELSYGKLVKEN